jgi:hypothetical protein
MAVLGPLLDTRFIRLAGRRPVVGKPFFYRTPGEFLAHFGLNSLMDLPPLAVFAELVGVELGPPTDGERAADGGSEGFEPPAGEEEE